MTLGFVIVLGAVQWYQILKKTFIVQREKRQNLNIGRTALQFLMSDLSTSGYRGCRTFDDNFPIRRLFASFSGSARFFKIDRKVFGFNATPGNCQGRVPEKICKRIKENSDVLVIYNIPKAIYFLKQDMKKNDEVLYTKGNHQIRKGSIALISDCFQGELFIAEEVENQKIFHRKTIQTNLTDSFNKLYKKGSEITELQTVAYYLGTPFRFEKDLGVYALYRDDLFHEAEEILDNIVGFQVEFGILIPPDTFQYKTASLINDDQWKLVRTVRLRIETKSSLKTKPAKELQNDGVWGYEFSI